jgi:hypothetical protein
MTRTSKRLRRGAFGFVTVALACCAEPEVHDGAGYLQSTNFLLSSIMYSAYDGAHEYSVAPYFVYQNVGPRLVPDPVIASSIRWEVDPLYVERSEFTELASAIKLTTKRVGTTFVKISASRYSGHKDKQTAVVHIHPGSPDAWEAGDARYKSGELVDSVLPPSGGDLDSACGLARDPGVPASAACVSCHDGREDLSTGYTSLHTAARTDEDLIDIVTTGQKPAGATFMSPRMNALEFPDCVFASFHTFAATEEEQRGLVLKLRSIPPQMTEDPDARPALTCPRCPD